MGLDIRLPIGLMFTLMGLILVVYGLFTSPAMYDRSLGYNVNLIWGACILAVGLIFLYLGRRGGSAMRSAETTVGGREMETREFFAGLEDTNPVVDPDEK